MTSVARPTLLVLYLYDMLREDQQLARDSLSRKWSAQWFNENALATYQKAVACESAPGATRAEMRAQLLAEEPELRLGFSGIESLNAKLGLHAPTAEEVDALLTELDRGQRRECPSGRGRLRGDVAPPGSGSSAPRAAVSVVLSRP